MIDRAFGEWLPSVPAHNHPGLIVADNITPIPGGYGPVYGPEVRGFNIGGTCRGAALFYRITGEHVVVAGTATGLHKITGTLATTGSLTTIGAGESWDFAQFNDLIVATSLANNPKYLDDIDTDDTWSDLTGSPPKARYCARVEEFLMLGDIENFPNRIQWSAFNSPAAAWAANRLTQAGFADLPRQFGRIQRIVGGRYPMVFQERGVNRLTYVGPPSIWRAEEIDQARGCVAPFSVVTVGFVTYYLGQDGFWATNGSTFEPIGQNKVDAWFWGNVDNAALREVHATVDWQNQCVVWAFKPPSSSFFQRAVRYSWAQNVWTTMTIVVDRLVETVYEGLTTEQLADLYEFTDDVQLSVDNPAWRARARSLAAFVSGQLVTYTGNTLGASVETGEFQPIPGRRAFLSRARVLGAGGQHWSIGTVALQNDRSETFTFPTSPGVDGFAPQRSDGQTIRVRCSVLPNRDWTAVSGVQLAAQPGGMR